jgi:hypothetical protein
MYASREAETFLKDLERPAEVGLVYLLERVIQPNAETHFGRRHNFAQLRTYEDYRTAVPIRNYEGFREDCERIVAGDANVLTAEPVKRFFMTSGSSNKPKLIPVTNSFVREKSRAFGIYWSLVFADHPGVKNGRMVTNFSDAGEAKPADQSGLPISSESAYWASVTAATQRKEPLIPKVVARIKDHRARYYAIARILLEEPFAAIMALNPSTLLVLFETLQNEQERLLADVRQGGISGELPIGDEVRSLIADRYRGNPDRAEVLEVAAKERAFVASRIFPGLELAVSWRSPMLSPYLQLLSGHLGDIGARDYLLMASEGVMAVPIKDGESGGAIGVGIHFYELIPHAEYGQPNPATILPHQAELGQEYVVVLSNTTGLYRYDIGDVVRVTGFVGPTPKIEFLHRAGNTSSLTGEKLTEAQVTAAVSKLAHKLGLELESFTLVPELGGGLPHYLLLAEARVEAPEWAWRQLQAGLDGALAAENSEYPSKRSSHRLGPPRVAKVAPGSYAARKARRVAEGAAELQVKPVHLSRDAKIAGELTIVETFDAG